MIQQSTGHVTGKKPYGLTFASPTLSFLFIMCKNANFKKLMQKIISYNLRVKSTHLLIAFSTMFFSSSFSASCFEFPIFYPIKYRKVGIFKTSVIDADYDHELDYS